MEREILSGKIIVTIDEKSNMVEMLKKIELMNISNEEKDMLFIITQDSCKNEKEEFIRILETIIKLGHISPNISFSKVIQDKINAINSKEREEIITIASNLKKRIENNEIVV